MKNLHLLEKIIKKEFAVTSAYKLNDYYYYLFSLHPTNRLFVWFNANNCKVVFDYDSNYVQNNKYENINCSIRNLHLLIYGL